LRCGEQKRLAQNDYAQNRACFRSGEVRIFDSTGDVERVIPFDDANRKAITESVLRT